MATKVKEKIETEVPKEEPIIQGTPYSNFSNEMIAQHYLSAFGRRPENKNVNEMIRELTQWFYLQQVIEYQEEVHTQQLEEA